MSARKPGVEPDRTADGLFAIAASIGALTQEIADIFNHIKSEIAKEDAEPAAKEASELEDGR